MKENEMNKKNHTQKNNTLFKCFFHGNGTSRVIVFDCSNLFNFPAISF